MRILWIPFTPWSSTGWDGSRHFHLLRHLEGHDIHVMAWDRARLFSDPPPAPPRHLPSWVTTHRACVLPRYWSLWRKGYPTCWDPCLNEWLLGAQLKLLSARLRPDLIVLTSTHYATGFVPLPAGIPVVLDHVDEMPDWVAKQYFARADAIAAVSPALVRNASACHPNVRLIENGVDVERYSPDKREAAKRELGLEGKVVVSLIGLTCSSRLYFLDAFEEFSKQVPNAVLLLVGDCKFRDRVEGRPADIRIAGHVPYDRAASYFNATDIGLYPGDDIPYFREAHPLKIVEYAAAGCQVVISPVDAFAEGWPNVRTCEPSAAAFTQGMLEVLKAPQKAPDVSSLAWAAKARQFKQMLAMTHSVSTSRNSLLESVAPMHQTLG